MRVYRIECKEGIGPYFRKENRIYECEHYKENIQIHPAPDQHKALQNSGTSRYSYGFTSIEELTAWFCVNGSFDVLLWLEEKGFVLSVFEASKYHQGIKQSIFIRNEEELVDCYSLTMLVEFNS